MCGRCDNLCIYAGWGGGGVEKIRPSPHAIIAGIALEVQHYLS